MLFCIPSLAKLFLLLLVIGAFLRSNIVNSSQGRAGSDHSSNRSYRLTLEEQRAIQEEVRVTGIAEAGDKAQALRDEKAADKGVAGVGPPVPGRDSGFCSEQDQLAQQAQGQCRSKLIFSL